MRSEGGREWGKGRGWQARGGSEIPHAINDMLLQSDAPKAKCARVADDGNGGGSGCRGNRRSRRNMAVSRE